MTLFHMKVMKKYTILLFILVSFHLVHPQYSQSVVAEGTEYYHPSMYQNIVVWDKANGEGNSWDIYAKDLVLNRTFLVANSIDNERWPTTNGNWIFYIRSEGYDYGEIYGYDILQNSTIRITCSGGVREISQITDEYLRINEYIYKISELQDCTEAENEPLQFAGAEILGDEVVSWAYPLGGSRCGAFNLTSNTTSNKTYSCNQHLTRQWNLEQNTQQQRVFKYDENGTAIVHNLSEFNCYGVGIIRVIKDLNQGDLVLALAGNERLVLLNLSSVECFGGFNSSLSMIDNPDLYSTYKNQIVYQESIQSDPIYGNPMTRIVIVTIEQIKIPEDSKENVTIESEISVPHPPEQEPKNEQITSREEDNNFILPCLLVILVGFLIVIYSNNRAVKKAKIEAEKSQLSTEHRPDDGTMFKSISDRYSSGKETYESLTSRLPKSNIILINFLKKQNNKEEIYTLDPLLRSSLMIDDEVPVEINKTEMSSIQRLIKKFGIEVTEIDLLNIFFYLWCREIEMGVFDKEGRPIDRFIDLFLSRYQSCRYTSTFPILLIIRQKEPDLNFTELFNRIEERYEELELEHMEKRYSSGLDSDFSKMSGHDFEGYLANRFKELGYKVERTPTSRDQGADLILEKAGQKIAVQAKHYSQPIGNKAIQEAHAGKGIYECDEAWVVTTSTFTEDAKRAAAKLNVRLIDKFELRRL